MTCFQEWTNLQVFPTHVSNPFIFIKRQSRLSCRCKEYAAKIPIYSSHFSCVIPCQKDTISIDSCYLPLIRINIAVTPPWTSSLCAISTVYMYPWCTRTLQYIHFIFLIQLHFVKRFIMSWLKYCQTPDCFKTVRIQLKICRCHLSLICGAAVSFERQMNSEAALKVCQCQRHGLVIGTERWVLAKVTPQLNPFLKPIL